MAWSKATFYYKHSLSGLTATSTATGDYDVANLLEMREDTFWKATTTADQYITFDAGVGNTITADYLAIAGHNLSSPDISFLLEYSSDNFASDINAAFSTDSPPSLKAWVKEFTSQTARYWRIKIVNASGTAASLAIAIWGVRTVLDFASLSYDSYAQNIDSNVNVSHAGYIAGIHERFRERKIRLQFNDVEAFGTIHTDLKAWFDDHGQQLTFLAWETTYHATDIFLVRSDGVRNWPLTNGGIYRNIPINLIGRVET